MPAPTIAMGAPQITMGPHKPPETKLLAIHPAAAAAAAAQQQHSQQQQQQQSVLHNGQQQHSQQQQQQQHSQQQQQQQLVGSNSKPGECQIEYSQPLTSSAGECPLVYGDISTGKRCCINWEMSLPFHHWDVFRLQHPDSSLLLHFISKSNKAFA